MGVNTHRAKDSDEKWMQHAIALAQRAGKANEIPVGAIMVLDENIIGEGWNQPIGRHDPTAHAEIIALRQACDTLQNYRLSTGVRLYVTLEPCVMCAGALIHARITRVIYGAADPRSGAGGSVFNILNTDRLNHRTHITGGVSHQQCSDLLQEFFKARR